MIDPRLFLAINGPTPQQAMLAPGFRPPGPGPGAPMMQPPQLPNMGIPGMGMMGRPVTGSPSTSGREMGANENDGLAGAVAGIQGIQPNADGTFSMPQMPTDIGSGQGGAGPGSFWSFMRGLIPPSGYTGGGYGGGWAP